MLKLQTYDFKQALPPGARAGAATAGGAMRRNSDGDPFSPIELCMDRKMDTMNKVYEFCNVQQNIGIKFI